MPGELEKGNAHRLLPAQLMELMRRESIETTLRFSVGTDARAKAEAAWAAFEAGQRRGQECEQASGDEDGGQLGMPIYPPCLANTLAGSEMGAGSTTQDSRSRSGLV